MAGHDEIKLTPAKEKELQKAIWEEVMRQNNRFVENHTLSDKEEENIAMLQKMTNLSYEEIKSIADTLRWKFEAQLVKTRKRIKPVSINIKKHVKRIVPVTIVLCLVLLFIKLIHGSITSNMLINAVSKGDYNQVKSLIAWGAEKNWKGDSDRTPLMEAARLGYIKIIHLLLERNANIRVRDESGNTAIEWAANDEVGRILGRAYAESFPPDSAVRKLWAMEIVYSYGNFIQSVTDDDRGVVGLFLDAGMKPVKKYNYGNNALDIALREDHIELYQLLLSKVRVKNSDEIHYNFFYAVLLNRVDIVRLLIDWGVNVKKAVHSDFNPLEYVSTKEMLELLLQYGAQDGMEERDADGQTLLMRIVLDDNIDDEERITMVKMLLDYGADPMASNTRGTLLKQARSKLRNEVVDLLLKAGAGE